MKRKTGLLFLTLLLTAVLIFSLASCSKNVIIDPSDNNTVQRPDNNGGDTPNDGTGNNQGGTQNGGGSSTDTPDTNPTDPDGDKDNPDTNPTDPDGDKDNPGTNPTDPEKPGDDTGDDPEIPSDISDILAEIVFNDATYTYDGTKKSLSVEGQLPSNITVKYFGNSISVAGTHTVTAKFYNNGIYIRGKDRTATLTINKARYDMSGISFYNRTLYYDGEAKSISIVGELPAGVSVSYEGNGNSAVGTYTVVAKFSGNTTNYHPIPDMTATMKIILASIDGIEFKSLRTVYDGTPKSIFITGELPAGVSVSYEGNGVTAAGSYEVTVRFISSDPKYQNIPPIKAMLIIDKADYNVEDIIFESAEFIIDGMPHSIYVSGDIHPNIKVTYKGNEKIGIGEHTVTALFNYLDSDNYNIPTLTEMTATMKISSNMDSSNGLLYEDNPDGSLSVSGYSGNQNYVVIPSTSSGKRVTAIKDEAFASSSLDYVYLGKHVTSIGAYAFRNSSVKEIGIAGKVDNIGKYAFVSSKLESFIIPSTVTQINEGTFMNCKALTSVYIPKSVSAVYDLGAITSAPFYGCTADIMIVLEDMPADGFGDYWCSVVPGEKALVIPCTPQEDFEENEDGLRAQSTDEADLRFMFLNGTPLVGFDPDVTEYTLVYNYVAATPRIDAVATSALADVTVENLVDDTCCKITLTVTSADGIKAKTFTVTLMLS